MNPAKEEKKPDKYRISAYREMKDRDVQEQMRKTYICPTCGHIRIIYKK